MNDSKQTTAGLCLAMVFILAAFAVLMNRPAQEIHLYQDPLPIRILNYEAVQRYGDGEVYLIDYAVGPHFETAQVPTEADVYEYIEYLATLGPIQGAVK